GPRRVVRRRPGPAPVRRPGRRPGRDGRRRRPGRRVPRGPDRGRGRQGLTPREREVPKLHNLRGFVMSCCVLAFAALFTAPADPPPADTCCLTYGQVQDIIAAVGYIPASSVSQCLIGSATHGTMVPTADDGEFR